MAEQSFDRETTSVAQPFKQTRNRDGIIPAKALPV